jgi:streptomycin 6-kinase
MPAYDFAPDLARWGLQPDGEPIHTHSSHLLPVRHRGAPAMLKVSVEKDEREGAVLMRWWDGEGAARVLAHDGDALLIERATGPRSLSAMARNGADDEATRILCSAALALHRPRPTPLPELIPLRIWFEALWPVAQTHGGLLRRSAEAAEALLSTQAEIVPLHGDLHHDNVLDFGARGWLAIDPKRLIGERGFEYAILFCDPDLADPEPPVATLPERFERRFEIVTADAGLEPRRQLQWILAWCGLSAAWFFGDGDPAEINLAIAAKAAAMLDA